MSQRDKPLGDATQDHLTVELTGGWYFKMRPDAWMSIPHTADAKTRAALMDLACFYWRYGRLPDNDTDLAKVVRMRPRDLRARKETLLELMRVNFAELADEREQVARKRLAKSQPDRDQTATKSQPNGGVKLLINNTRAPA